MKTTSARIPLFGPILMGLLSLVSATPAPAPGGPASLDFLIGKRVVSVVKMTKANAAAPGETAQGGATMVMTGPSEQQLTRQFAVRKGKMPNELQVEQLVQRVQMTVVSPLGKSQYDSDNSFERDVVTAALGQRYDPYVGKAHTSSYLPDATQPMPDSKFENIWTTNLPTLNSSSIAQGIVLAHLPAAPAPGTTWADSVSSGETTTLNRYRVLKKEGDLLQLALTSRLAPGARTRQTSTTNGPNGVVSATNTVNTIDFEGEMSVRQTSGFIEAMHLTKRTSSVVNTGSQHFTNNALVNVELTNALR